jgi:hypothetical protein
MLNRPRSCFAREEQTILVATDPRRSHGTLRVDAARRVFWGFSELHIRDTVAAGSEDSTNLSITTSTSQESVTRVYRITGWHGTGLVENSATSPNRVRDHGAAGRFIVSTEFLT